VGRGGERHGGDTWAPGEWVRAAWRGVDARVGAEGRPSRALSGRKKREGKEEEGEKKMEKEKRKERKGGREKKKEERGGGIRGADRGRSRTHAGRA